MKRDITISDVLAEHIRVAYDNRRQHSNEELMDEYCSSGTTSERKKEIETELICHNFGVVTKIVNSLMNRTDVSREDLIAEGIDGFLHAIRKFQPSHKTNLVTYARNWVNQRVRLCISKNGGGASTPVKDYNIYIKTSAVKKRLIAAGYAPTYEQISMECGPGYTPDLVKKHLEHVTIGNDSLNAPIGGPDDTQSQLIDTLFIPDRDKTGEEKILEEASLALMYQKVKSVLSERQFYVLTHLMGLFGIEPIEAKIIAQSLKCQIQEVKRIESEAIGILRENQHLMRELLD